MPRLGVTEYDLLLSCPGDVVERYYQVVKDCVESFNKSIGEANRVTVTVKHWSTDSYAQSGGKPQEILNNQFVHECDFAVALLWTRFGTPTDEYGSGTEEEISDMLSAGKQVFMYFINEAKRPSDFDSQQFENVQRFKEEYSKKGEYFSVEDTGDFKTLFTNHLTMYMMNIIMSGNCNSFGLLQEPKLSICDYFTRECDAAKAISLDYRDSNFFKSKKREIDSLFDSLMKDYLPQREIEIYEYSDNDIFTDKMALKETSEKILLNLGEFNLSVTDDQIEKITKYANNHKRDIPDEFWFLGNLKGAKSLIPASIGGGGISLIGSDEEKKRFDEIEKLYWKIVEYDEYEEYFASIYLQKKLGLVLMNRGTTYDEDIDVRLFFEKGCILQRKRIAIPGENIINSINENRFLEFAFGMKSTENIDSYCDYGTYPIDVNKSFRNNPLYVKSSEEEYQDEKHYYEKILEYLHDYEIYEREDADIVVIHFSYIKHNTSVALPALLLMKKVPKTIRYEISSKHIPEVVKGEITVSE